MCKLPRAVTLTLHVVMESSSDDSGDNEMVEGEIESEDDDVAIVDEEHETSQTTSTLSSAANNSSGNLLKKKRQPRSLVWKFFSTLQDQTKYHHGNVLPSSGGKSIVHDTVYFYL